MNKLIVHQAGVDNLYIQELAATERISRERDWSRTMSIDLKDLSVDFLLEKQIDVVASTGLSKEWYYLLKGLEVVTITFDSRVSYKDYADIVIDFQSNDNVQYFTGQNSSVYRNPGFDVLDVLDVVRKLEWDSRFFGFPIAYVSCRNLSKSIIHRINRFVEVNEIQLIEYLCNCHDNRSVAIAEHSDFHFTDIRITLERKIEYHAGFPLPTEIRFGRAGKDHIPYLMQMSKELYKDSRYYFDGKFTRGRIDEFYASWVEKAVLGTFDHECFCFFVNDQPIGYCTIRYNKNETCTIGLFGFSSGYQGRGLGKLLLQSVINELSEKDYRTIQVVTQGRNYLAQRLYQQTGFLTKSTELWYHKWVT